MVVLTGIFIIYFLLLVIFLVGWKSAMQQQAETPDTKEPLITVIIAVRNEALTIGNLLRDLSVQEYKNFEIIVVNDYSEDETLETVGRLALKNLHILHNWGTGKKAAITVGVRTARGSIIVTTDADCSVPPRWLKHIRAQFRNPEVMMAFGGVRLESRGRNSFFDSLQAMEFSSLIGTGASTAALGFPTLCNGANLAFRKKVFSEVKGYEGNGEIPSGDDEFLLRKIQDRYPGSIRFMNSTEVLVSTHSEPTPEGFLNQRIRWASKWRFNSSLVARGLAVLVLITQVVFIVNWFYVFSPRIVPSLFLIVIKMILEAAFLLQVCRYLGTRWNWLAFFSLQIIYPLYVIAVAATSFLMPYQWKNRTFKPRWPDFPQIKLPWR